MRLAIVASHPIQYHAPLFRELARRVDLVVFFAHRATPNDQASAGFGVEFDWDIDLLSGYGHVFLKNVARNPSLENFSGCDTPDLGGQLADGCFDAVLLMGWRLKSSVQALIAAKRVGVPAMARGDSHLETPRSAIKKTVKALTYPGFLRSFDAALYVGMRSRAYWKHYGYPDSRLFFSPHCVDGDWFAGRATAEARAEFRSSLGIGPDAKLVLFAGRLVASKRPLDLIEAVSRVNSRGADIQVLVAGAGPLESEVIAAGETLGVSCQMLGFRNQSEMPAVYAATDILVLPSDGRETWGLVANEALACGRPVVIADAIGCAPDLAADGSAGRVFTMGNIEDLAAALLDILTYPPEPAAIASKSQDYSLGAAAEGIVRAGMFAIETRRKKIA